MLEVYPSSHQSRRRVAEAAKEMAICGFVRGSSGQRISLMGPACFHYSYWNPLQRARASQIIAIDLKGQKRLGTSQPSSEWRMHVAIYRAREDVRAILHTHSPCASAVAAALQKLPLVNDERRLLFGGSIPVSRYAPPGTWKLAQAVAAAFGEEGEAVLIARHGAVAVGFTLRETLILAEKIEEMAQLFWLAQAIRDRQKDQGNWSSS